MVVGERASTCSNVTTPTTFESPLRIAPVWFLVRFGILYVVMGFLESHTSFDHCEQLGVFPWCA